MLCTSALTSMAACMSDVLPLRKCALAARVHSTAPQLARPQGAAPCVLLQPRLRTRYNRAPCMHERMHNPDSLFNPLTRQLRVMGWGGVLSLLLTTWGQGTNRLALHPSGSCALHGK